MARKIYVNETAAEKKARIAAYKKAYRERQKAKEAAYDYTKADVENTAQVVAPQVRLAQLEQENNLLKAKVAQYEKLCQSFANQADQSTKQIQAITLEYNARTKYMLDCVKHAYMSMQFAVNAVNKTQKGENNND